MKIAFIPGLGLIALASVTTSIRAQTPRSTPHSQSSTLLQFDFNGATPWPKSATYSSSPVINAKVVSGPVGTIDESGSTKSSGGIDWQGDCTAASGNWQAGFSSGPLAVRNTEKNLGKLTLSFSLSASGTHPIAVRLASLDAHGKRTGALEGMAYPPAPNFYQRYVFDLSDMKPSGAGKFQPDAPLVQLAFEIGSAAEWPAAKNELSLDNVHFATPAWYVSEKGSDQNDGRTETTAFATPQKAVDSAGPGDIIDVMNGTYLPKGVQEGIARFKKPGSPAAWISLKNYPGHHPLFASKGTWNAVRFWYTNEQAAADAAAGVVAPVPAYIEVRGLHIRGNGDTAKQQYPDLMGQAAPETNSNGISVSWDGTGVIPHHLRFADNIVEYCPGGGIGPGSADWTTIEHNIIRNNCWTTIYATSGISLNHGSNFTGVEGAYTQLIRDNVVSGNRTFLAWKQIGKVSDGNGIIIDVNQDNKLPPEQRFYGRTLIQNNVSFNNGGSGIHSFKSKRVDIINNTVYLNSASPELDWGQLFVQQSDDVRMINNIVVAPPDQPVNTCGPKGGDQNSTNIYREGNLYFGGGSDPLMGDKDVIGDPQFVNASIDDKVADFRLKPGSPAIGTASTQPFLPAAGLNGKLRGTKPDKGAYQR